MKISTIKFNAESPTTAVAIECDDRTIYTQTDNPQYGDMVDSWVADGNTIELYTAPEPPAPPTAAEKLASAGLSVDELKELLGL
jgi:hypothetical protein